MLRLAWLGVRFARGRAVALAAGMLVAAVAFSLLTASVEVSAANVKGVVNANDWKNESPSGPRTVSFLPVSISW